MTREDAKKAAEIMLAYANGEEIESLFYGEYVSCEEPSFNWVGGRGVENYRIKAKEKFDPKTLKPFDKVIVKDYPASYWNCDFFSRVDDSTSNHKFITIGYAYKFCIPYNDDTKHLVGTTEEAPEFYRYWED